ncbi:MAG: DegQ family serine endoprotease [Gammaproteobacteria bacterium]|nr:DegQ family serine endoprotease [Gammaproteobacteria bacterium]MCW8909272.1 DegQ family serine endoprotease [Gammaproteobacteria bacterium]
MKSLLFLVLFTINSLAFAALPARVNGQELPSLAPMVEQVVPAVVNISTRSHASIAQNPLFNDPFFRRFFNVPQQREQVRPQSLGSGVVIDAEKGYVITNHHVIGRADEITVTLRDGRALSAKLLGSDPEADVAVLQVKAENLSAIRLADSDQLRVGDFVVAIGNPFGLGQTVTSGIVSAMGRSGLGIEGYEDFIQTDASINPGNSGGALVNLNGDLVGMNTAILSPGGGGGNVGIGFAIPVNMVSQIVDQLVEHGEVSRGVLGVVTQDLTPDLAQAFGIKARKGAVISKVIPDSPAQAAGIKSGDVVIEVNGRDIENSMDMRNAVGLVRIGEKLNIRLIRDNREIKLKASIKKPEQRNIAGEKISPRLAGATIGQLQDKDDSSVIHIVVLEVKQGSPAWYARLQKGDEILSVNRKSVKNLDELRKYAKGSGQLLLNIQRGSAALFILLK